MSFDILGLKPELLRAIAEQGYEQPTPIQKQAIPLVLTSRDLLAGAQTGTGKTAGFALPMLQQLTETPPSPGMPRPIRGLILTPTRELASQVHESVVAYSKYLPIRSAVIFGGVGMNPQIERLHRGVDILVATPGRLLDHARQKTVDLRHITIFVLDEADRMLDMGFIHDVRKVMSLLPQRRQNLLFSATFSDEIRRLANQVLKDPAEIAVAPRNATADRIEQRIYPIEKERKRALLSWLIGSGNWRQVLVFTRTKHGADRLARQLEQDGIRTAVLHGDKSQGARTKALEDFKTGKVSVLVATDIAGRGLDIDQLPHVVNFELPNVPEDYVHRIGRTGRAGAAGSALSLVSEEETKQLQAIERLLKQELPRSIAPGFEPNFSLVTAAPPHRAQSRKTPGDPRRGFRGEPLSRQQGTPRKKRQSGGRIS